MDLMDDLLARMKESCNIQMSSERMLCFLVNDMLDFAQMKAGKFRKAYESFKLKKSVSDVLMILKFKAD